jgi:Ca-activated chloride channel homolog
MRSVVGVLVGVLLAGLAPAPAARAAGELAPTILVLDSSGSMDEAAPGGTKMAAAKRAVRTLVDALPAEAQLGLAVYGAGTGNAASDKAAGCKDVKVVHPVGPLDKAAVIRSADAAKPRGYTPIGRSLRAAADALPKEGPRSIVLVSDGEDTCAPPDPCEVAKQLAKEGVERRRPHAPQRRIRLRSGPGCSPAPVPSPWSPPAPPSTWPVGPSEADRRSPP